MIQVDSAGLQQNSQEDTISVQNNNEEEVGDNDKETSGDEIVAATVASNDTETPSATTEDEKMTEDDVDAAAECVESSSIEAKITSSGLNNHKITNSSSSCSSKSVKKPNLDKVVEKINHNNKKEISSVNINNNNNLKSSRKNFKMSDLIGDRTTPVNGNHSEPHSGDEDEEIPDQQQQQTAAALAAAQQLMGANPAMFNPAMFPTGQAFQNVVAQFTANAVANNMDMDNVALLKSALFTLQQQQFLQFQLIQHLHSQLLRNNEREEGENAERSETESEMAKRDEEAARRTAKMQFDSPLKRLEEQSARQELDLSNRNKKSSPSRSEVSHSEKVSMQHHMQKQAAAAELQANTPLTPNRSTEERSAQDIPHPYQHNFSLASNIITDHDSLPPMNESNSLAMLEKKAQEVLNSASQGILSNNLLDELAFANEKSSPNGRNDPALFKHRCRYCGKIFGSDSSLQIHIRSHTGERPFKCNVCGSRFTTKGNLKVHFQRHTEKYPHIPMNPNPVPEHLDKYFPPLIPSEALKEQAPTGPPTPGSERNSAPPPPSGLPGQFPPGFPARFPDFFMPRPPPFDLFTNPMIAAQAAAAELARKPVDLSQVRKPDTERSMSPQSDMRLSPEVVLKEEDEPTIIKEEPMDETLDLSDKSHNRDKSPERDEDEEEAPSRDDHEREREYREREMREREREMAAIRANSQPNHQMGDGLAKVPSVSPSRSSSSSTSGSLYQDTVLDPAFFPSHLARPDSRDSSWENFIEISSETSKLQELVDNIDNKTTEPNQCLVCKKVLSCRSALQMHYRVHTGERPFRCKICGRSFTTKGNLKTHMSVHRIKPPMRTLHQCPVCHQKFSNIFVLQQHIRLHTGEMTDLTPEQIRAAEIREFPDHPPEMKMHPFANMGRMPEFNHNHKRMAEMHSDDENGDEINEPPSPKRLQQEDLSKRENLRSRAPSSLVSPSPGQAEDLRAMNIHRLSVRSNEELSRDSSPVSQASTEPAKRMRSSSPLRSSTSPPPSMHHSTRSPITTPPGASDLAQRPPFPYGPPFLAMPHLPPFMQQAPFMRTGMPLVPSSAGMPPFGLFGVRGNTTTCNICFKTFACNSALEIHYRSHTKERPFKCTICDRGFSTKGNMKQHMLTHKIRDMFGNSNSGDESRMSSTSQDPSMSAKDSESGGSQINFAIKLEKSRSPENFERSNSENRDKHSMKDDRGSPASDYAGGNDFNGMSKEADIKKWCNKLNEMPENIAAS
ncbi:homeotic protein spalt-major [Culicoides brevitarsis]|uniref:homeotic protein spalt-major n=1 Tax=Culicoides brevitarsis TaxID=469753 RepID=UPI00307C1A96